MRWRPMRTDDAATALDVANAIHLSYPEDPLVVRDRLALYPEGCFVLADDAGLYGYFVSHPWVLGEPPALNCALGALPDRPDCFYLHDMALLPSVRGQGHAVAALDIVLRQARAGGFPTLFLMAVGDAHGFWEQTGFSRCETSRPDPAKGYGPEAAAYIRRV
ncbi:MAG TPA: GNAT family N-acetyltransferase [Brevundimonas sp.]|nr:GNAT family N-acetyltransferase [Brevundimonas sp.]